MASYCLGKKKIVKKRIAISHNSFFIEENKQIFPSESRLLWPF